MLRRITAFATLALIPMVAVVSVLMAGGSAEVGDPADEQREFSILIPWNDINVPPEENWNTIEHEKRTGIHVNWQVVPADGWQEQRGVIIASGDLPDVIAATLTFGGSAFTDSELFQYGSQGVFTALNPYIESDSVYLKGIFEENPVIANFVKSLDGNIYSFPQFQKCYHCHYSQKAWINVDWLDALGLSMPTTTEELRDVLIAFKTQDPNGNGLADEQPISSAVDGWRTNLDGWLMTPFIYTDGQTRVYLDSNGQIQYVPAQPGYRDGLRYIAGLYSEGLIAPETFTQNAGGLTQTNLRGNEPVVGMGFGGVNFLVLGDTSSTWRQYGALPPIAGPDGFRTSGFFDTSPAGTGSMVVTSAAEDPGMIVEWMDWLYTDEANLFREMGPEGVGWRDAEPGEVDILGRQAQYHQILSTSELGAQNLVWANHIPGGSLANNLKEVTAVNWPDWRDAPDLGAAMENMLFRESRAYEAVAPELDEVVPPFAVLPEDVTDFTLLQTTLTDHVVESFARFVTGQLDVDSDWDQYVRRLDQLGLAKYLEIVQDGYEAKYGGN